MSSESEPTNTGNKPAKTDNAKNISNNKTLLIVVGAVVLLAIAGFALKSLVLTNNDNAIEKAIYTASNGDVSVDANTKDNSVTVSDKEGNTTTLTTNEELPEDFPSYIPLYTSQTIESSYRIDAPEGGTNWSVTAESDDDAATIKNFFVDNLSDWTKTDELFINGGYTLVFTKDENTTLSLTISPNDSGPASDIYYVVTVIK